MREMIRRLLGVSLHLRLTVRPGDNDAPSSMPPLPSQRGRRRILVVCSSNACRSPFVAQALQRNLGDDEWQVVSAGTDATDGEAVPEDKCAAAAEYGVDLSFHRARRVTRELVSSADLVIALSGEQVDALLELEPGATRKVRLLGGFRPTSDAWEVGSGTRRSRPAESADAAESQTDSALDHECGRELIAGVDNLSRFIVRREASRRPPDDRSPLSTPPLRTARAR